ncbi:MAG: class I SAM-dependent methyltransferase [Rhodospirillales bacterium]
MVDWNRRYRESGQRLFGSLPNEYLREVLARSDVDPRRVLCLGDGDGRNGTWLAGEGCRVTAVDVSAVATEQAVALDRAAGVTVERVTADLADWRPGGGDTWDAVAMIYLQCEETVRSRAIAESAAALDDGGWFIAEGFSRAGVDADSPGPKSPDLLYYLHDIAAALPGFRIVEAFDGAVWLEEGARHRGHAFVVRVLARKLPAA